MLAEDGRVFAGANVENAAYPLSACAERSAVQAAVSRGVRRVIAAAVVSSGEGPTWPCGGCRQVLHEFGTGAVLTESAGGTEERSLDALLPDAFGPEDLP